jgi:hypothetical protein
MIQAEVQNSEGACMNMVQYLGGLEAQFQAICNQLWAVLGTREVRRDTGGIPVRVTCAYLLVSPLPFSIRSRPGLRQAEHRLFRRSQLHQSQQPTQDFYSLAPSVLVGHQKPNLSVK